MQPNVSENPTVCMCYGKKFQADSFGWLKLSPHFSNKRRFHVPDKWINFFKKILIPILDVY